MKKLSIILLLAATLIGCSPEEESLCYENVYDPDTNSSIYAQVDCETGELLIN